VPLFAGHFTGVTLNTSIRIMVNKALFFRHLLPFHPAYFHQGLLRHLGIKRIEIFFV